MNWHLYQINLLIFRGKAESEFSLKDAFADISSNAYQINQKMSLPRSHLKNSTSFTKLLGKVSMGIVNNTEFTAFSIIECLSDDDLPLFSQNSAHQTVLFNDGFSDTYLTLNYKLRHQTIDLKTGAEWVWQDVESELNPLPQAQDVLQTVCHGAQHVSMPNHRIGLATDSGL